MNKLSKEKRQQLVLVALLTTAVLGALGWGVIRSQQLRLRRLASSTTAAEHKLQGVKQTIANADRIESELAEAGKRLAGIEEDGMASGDLYAWAIGTIRQFKLGYKVEIPQYSQIDGPKDVSMLPQFPYKQLTLTIVGTAHFYDFGRFIADFENRFPYVRVQNLVLEPVSSDSIVEREKLTFRMEISALVRPAAS